MKTSGRVIHGGMGGFLNPPGHPEHEWHVETDLRRRPENRGSMSLSAAVEAEWLEGLARAEARSKLESWQPLPLSDPAVRKWIVSVMNYLRNCFRGEGPEPECWHASNLVIHNYRPVDEEHAGVHLIRQYYPGFTLADIVIDETAPWGKNSGKEASS